MKPGQRVRATVLLESKDDVLSVPREAVIDEEGGARIVYRRSGGEFEPVKVRLGSSALGRVVIADGLEEGDVIALGDPTEPESGQETGNGRESASKSPGVAP